MRITSLPSRIRITTSSRVILVGEVRDKETIEIALEAAETGFLVLSTLRTIERLRLSSELWACFRWQSNTRFATAWPKGFVSSFRNAFFPKRTAMAE